VFTYGTVFSLKEVGKWAGYCSEILYEAPIIAASPKNDLSENKLVGSTYSLMDATFSGSVVASQFRVTTKPRYWTLCFVKWSCWLGLIFSEPSQCD